MALSSGSQDCGLCVSSNLLESLLPTSDGVLRLRAIIKSLYTNRSVGTNFFSYPAMDREGKKVITIFYRSSASRSISDRVLECMGNTLGYLVSHFKITDVVSSSINRRDTPFGFRCWISRRVPCGIEGRSTTCDHAWTHMHGYQSYEAYLE